jgi:hypothetical protein
MKTITITVLLFAVTIIPIMVSCAPSTEVYLDLASLTPVITATPITQEANTRDVSQTMHDIFKENPACKSYDAMNAKQDILEFFDVNEQVGFDRLIIQEIADSAHNKFRAYIVTDPIEQLSNCEAGCFPERIYIKDFTKGEVRGINWNGYMPGRITYKLIWIEDNILAFQQTVNPYNYETIAVDINQQIIIYRSLASCN